MEGVVRREDFAWQKLKPSHYVDYDVLGKTQWEGDNSSEMNITLLPTYFFLH